LRNHSKCSDWSGVRRGDVDYGEEFEIGLQVGARYEKGDKRLSNRTLKVWQMIVSPGGGRRYLQGWREVVAV
jgi:hypothetical protein